MSNDTKLPVIFGCMVEDLSLETNNIKSIIVKVAEQGYIIVNVNYALAPQYKYPTPLVQLNQAVKFIKENKHELPIDFDQVVIGETLLALS